MLERSTVMNRLLAIGMLGAMGLMLAPEPAWGQSALKEKPPGHSHRFPPLPDKIQRLDAYRQRRERAGILSKFVYWAAESGSEPTGTIIIDMPSSGPARMMPDGEPTWVAKPGITITPSESQPSTTRRVMPGNSGRAVDPNIRQVSATNDNQLVHELVVPAANDPSLPPLPDQVQPTPSRKPKVPMIRRVPEISSDTVDSAIQQVSNEEKIANKDLPPVRGTKAATPVPSAVVAATVPPAEPTLRPLVINEKPKVVAAKPKVVTQKPKVVAEKPKVVAEKPEVVTTNSVPRQLPNLSPEKKAAPKATAKKVVKKQPTTTPRPSTPARPAVANNSRRHPSSVRSSDIRRTSADSAHTINSTAVVIPAKASDNDNSTEDAKPRSLPGLVESKELPPVPTDAEVLENQRKFEEALRKAAKKPAEVTVESDPTDLTLPTDPVADETAAAPVEFAVDATEVPTPAVEETVPTLDVATDVSTPAVETTMPEEVADTIEPTPAAEPVMPAPVVETISPAPVVETAAPTPVVEAPAIEAGSELPVTQEMPAPVVTETAPSPSTVPPTVPATEAMSEEEALAKLEASVPTQVADELAVLAEPPVVPSQRVVSTEPAPIPSAAMPDDARAQVVEEFLDARSELESLAQGVAIPSTDAPGLNEAKLELEALVQGRPIPRTTTPASPAVIPNELIQAEEELAALSRQKQMPAVPPQKKVEMPLPSELPRTVLPVPKATSSTGSKVVPAPTKPGSLSTTEIPAPNAVPLKTASMPKVEETKTVSMPKVDETKSVPTPKAETMSSATSPKAAAKAKELKTASSEKGELKKSDETPKADPTKISSLPKPESKTTVAAPVIVPTAEPQKSAAMPRAEPKRSVAASNMAPTKASAPKASPAKTAAVTKTPTTKPTVAPKTAPAKMASAPKSNPTVNQAIADKMATLPDLPPQVEAAPVMPADVPDDIEPTLPGPKLVNTKPSVASDRPALKSNDVTELAEEIKKAKKPSPNPFSLTSKEKGTKNSGMASQPAKSVASATPEPAKSADAKLEPRSTAPVAPPAIASKSPAIKPLPTDNATPSLSPLPDPLAGTDVADSKESAKPNSQVSAPAALPSASSLPSPPRVDPAKPMEIASKDGPPKKGAEQIKNPTAPLPGGLTFGLHAIEEGFLEATKPSKELATPTSSAGQQAEGKKSPLSPPRFNVSKLETFDDPTAKASAKAGLAGQPQRSPSLKPAELVALVPDQEVVVESPSVPAPFDQDIAAKLIKSMKDSSDCQGSMQELAQMEYWYRASGAVVAVGQIAQTHSDVAVRVNALKILGTAPTTMSEATSTLRALASDAKEPAVRQAAETIIIERTASAGRPSIR